MSNEMLNTYSPFTDAINNRFPLINAIIVKENKSRNLCINNYILHRQIGRGSYAQVRLARDVYQEEDVALRILNRKQLSKKLGAIKRADAMINNCLKVMAQLDTQYIVQCKEFLYTNILLYDLSQSTKYLPISHELAKQFVDLPQIIGQLAEQEDSEVEIFKQQITPRFTSDTENMQNVCVFVLEKADSSLFDQINKFDYNQLRSYIFQAICAVNHMHQKRIVYNDFKAENLLLFTARNQVKLSDFETSTILPEVQTMMTLDQLYQLEGHSLDICSRSLQNVFQAIKEENTNKIVQFPQHITQLIIDPMLYNYTISEIGFQTPGITAPESRHGSIHIGELSDVWQFGQLLLNVFMGLRSNLSVQRGSADEKLIALYYNDKLGDLIAGTTSPQTLRYNSFEAIQHPFFTNQKLLDFKLQHLEKKFNEILSILQKQKFYVKRSVSVRSQGEQAKQQKMFFTILKQELLKNFNLETSQHENEIKILPLRKPVKQLDELASGQRFDDIASHAKQTKQLFKYINTIISKQIQQYNRSASIPTSCKVRRKFSVQEFIQNSYAPDVSIPQLEEFCSNSIKYLDVRGYKARSYKISQIRKQLEMQQLVKLCIYINYYRLQNHVCNKQIHNNTEITLPERVTPTLSVADYIKNVLRNSNSDTSDSSLYVQQDKQKKRYTPIEPAYSISNNSSSVQTGSQIFKTDDIPAVVGKYQGNDINIKDYDQIISDESDVDLPCKYNDNSKKQQQQPLIGLNLNLQLPQMQNTQGQNSVAQSNLNKQKTDNTIGGSKIFDKSKLGFKLSQSPFSSQSSINPKQTHTLSNLGFNTVESNSYKVENVSQCLQCEPNLSGDVIAGVCSSKSNSFIIQTMKGSAEYMPQNDSNEVQKYQQQLIRSSVVQQPEEENKKIQLNEFLTIQECQESSCILDVNVYEDIGECSLSSDI